MEQLELDNDPTQFSAISKSYQDTVRYLLGCPNTNLPEGISAATLASFKSVYTDSAFICRYLDCPRHSHGFSSATKRNDHENTHAKPLRCGYPSCEFFTRGFASRGGLLRHKNKCHPRLEDAEPPLFELRKEIPPPVPPRRIELPTKELPKPGPPPAIQPIESEQPSKRIKRGKRGMKVHKCHLCPKIYTRAEGLRQVS
jgi:hypothetical protein